MNTRKSFNFGLIDRILIKMLSKFAASAGMNFLVLVLKAREQKREKQVNRIIPALNVHVVF